MSLHSAAVWLLRLLGCLLIYAAVFLYEDEEGRAQNRVEQWRDKIGQTKAVSVSKVTALMNAIAKLVSQFFDRMFGKHLFSARGAVVSVCYPSKNHSSILPVTLSDISGSTYGRAGCASSPSAVGSMEIKLAKGTLQVAGNDPACSDRVFGRMIGLPAGTRIWIAAGVTDLGRGFTGLSGMVQTTLQRESVFRALKTLDWIGQINRIDYLQ